MHFSREFWKIVQNMRDFAFLRDIFFLLAVRGKISCDKGGVKKKLLGTRGGGKKSVRQEGGIRTLPFRRRVTIPFPPMPKYGWTEEREGGYWMEEGGQGRAAGRGGGKNSLPSYPPPVSGQLGNGRGRGGGGLQTILQRSKKGGGRMGKVSLAAGRGEREEAAGLGNCDQDILLSYGMKHKWGIERQPSLLFYIVVMGAKGREGGLCLTTSLSFP